MWAKLSRDGWVVVEKNGWEEPPSHLSLFPSPSVSRSDPGESRVVLIIGGPCASRQNALVS